MIPHSVLDLSPVPQGLTPADALANSCDLAQHAERWGYRRFWLAEHHNMRGIASAATSVVIGHVAGQTRTIRVGAGGVMLPNHAPLVIAEQFGTLATLYPGRIDLGIGRAPGTDQRTARALRRAPDTIHGEAFLQQLAELEAFMRDDVPADHPFADIRAVPGGTVPPIWLLGSSGFSAQVAALTSRPFSFAYHFAPDGLQEALGLYRERFVPSDDLPEPHVMLGVNVVCAPTDHEAQRLAGSGRLMRRRLRRGDLQRVPSPETALAELGPPDPAQPGTSVVGSPDTVRRGLAELVERTGVQELMVSSVFHDGADHVTSLELVAGATGLADPVS